VCNTFGTCNNVVTVRSSDFEVFEALSIDSASTGRDVHSKYFTVPIHSFHACTDVHN